MFIIGYPNILRSTSENNISQPNPWHKHYYIIAHNKARLMKEFYQSEFTPIKCTMRCSSTTAHVASHRRWYCTSTRRKVQAMSWRRCRTTTLCGTRSAGSVSCVGVAVRRVEQRLLLVRLLRRWGRWHLRLGAGKGMHRASSGARGL